MKSAEQQDPQMSAIIAAALEIHRQLGHGFVQAIYKDAAVIEFALRNIPYQREVLLPIKYKDYLLPTHYKADFICFSDILVEFAAMSDLSNFEEMQVLNSLKATGIKRGLLLNFGSVGLQYKSLIRDCEGIQNSKNKPVSFA
jgi:GxxExxY protein